MRQPLTACERCGLREVRHELEQRGVIIRFCEECYWGEFQEPDRAEPQPDQPAAAGPSSPEAAA